MCNGETGRASQGGVVAFLRSTTGPHGLPPSSEQLSLHLTKNGQHGGTLATLKGFETNGSNSQVVIHRDGDLRSELSLEASTLHRFAVPYCPTTHGAASFPLASVLNLGVGGDGVVGRRVSLISDHVVVGQGIMGYN